MPLKSPPILALLLGAALLASQAHPGSGIVIDRQGRIFFTDTGQGVWQIGQNGQVAPHPGPAYHWMTIDHANRAKAGPWPDFVEPSTRIEKFGADPALFLASDFPVAAGADSSLYYPEFSEGGPLRIYKVDPAGRRSVVISLQNGADGKKLQWLNGIVAGSDGSIYFTENAAVRKVRPQGELSTIASRIVVPDCRRIDGAPEELGPLLRGLDVAADGTIYVAASACCAVLKITPQGAITPILRLEPPWSPTGVATSGENVFVLEYLHSGGNSRRDWIPRVRKISANGSSAIIAAIERSGPSESKVVAIPER